MPLLDRQARRGNELRAVGAAVDAASDQQRRLHIAVVVPGGGAIKPVLLFDDDEHTYDYVVEMLVDFTRYCVSGAI